MKQIVILLTFIMLFNFSCTKKSKTENISNNQEDTITEEKLLRHVVLFKFNDESTAKDIEKINNDFYELSKQIKIVKDFEWGINDSPENFHQGFTHCYTLTFDSEQDRDSIYTPHPLHKKFVASLGPHLEKVFVVDYWANR